MYPAARDSERTPESLPLRLFRPFTATSAALGQIHYWMAGEPFDCAGVLRYAVVPTHNRRMRLRGNDRCLP